MVPKVKEITRQDLQVVEAILRKTGSCLSRALHADSPDDSDSRRMLDDSNAAANELRGCGVGPRNNNAAKLFMLVEDEDAEAEEERDADSSSPAAATAATAATAASLPPANPFHAYTSALAVDVYCALDVFIEPSNPKAGLSDAGPRWATGSSKLWRLVAPCRPVVLCAEPTAAAWAAAELGADAGATPCCGATTSGLIERVIAAANPEARLTPRALLLARDGDACEAWARAGGTAVHHCEAHATTSTLLASPRLAAALLDAMVKHAEAQRAEAQQRRARAAENAPSGGGGSGGGGDARLFNSLPPLRPAAADWLEVRAA